MVVTDIENDIPCLSTFSLDDVPLRVSAPQPPQMWASTELELTSYIYLQGSFESVPAGPQPWAIPVRARCPGSSHAAGQPHPSSLKHQVPKQIPEMMLQKIVPAKGMKTN